MPRARTQWAQERCFRGRPTLLGIVKREGKICLRGESRGYDEATNVARVRFSHHWFCHWLLQRAELCRVSPTLQRTLLRDDVISMTPREAQVLALLRDGLTPKEMAEGLNISLCAVYFTLQDLRERYRARTNAHLIALTNPRVE